MLKPTRRDLLKLSAAAPALTLATPSHASIAAPQTSQNAGFFKFTLGQAQVTVVSDGHLEIPASGLGVNVDPDEVASFLKSYFLSPETNYSHTNNVIIELGDAVVLVDVGSGSRFQETAGRLLDNMSAAGIDPDSITHVLLTHAHPDHIWGIRDDFDEALFPQAKYYIGSTEYDWWMKEDRVNEVSEGLQQMVVGAVNSLTTIEEQIHMVSGETEIVPGISMIDTPGHTLGHMSVMVTSNDQSLMILGDAISHAYISFAHPEWIGGFDMDGEMAVNTRRRLLDATSTDGTTVIAYHFPFPGVGHVRQENGKYQFIPALWQWENG